MIRKGNESSDSTQKFADGDHKRGTIGKGELGCIAGIALVVVGLIVFVVIFLNSEKTNKDESNPFEQTSAPIYREPSYDSPIVTIDTTSAIKEIAPQAAKPMVKELEMPKLSAAYEEGYDKGYDDGEDDAVMDNGWGGQYDDECHYKGKKRRDYLLGYEEGYEAGFYDNKAGDD